MLRYIYDRSKNNQGNLILRAGSRAEDTFMNHNNKDNSIKTPIIARYNTLRWDTDREYSSSVYLSSYEQHQIYYVPQRFVRFQTFPCGFSRLPAIYLRKYLHRPPDGLSSVYISLAISPGPRLRLRDQPGQVGGKLFVGPRRSGGVASRLGNDQVTNL